MPFDEETHSYRNEDGWMDSRAVKTGAQAHLPEGFAHVPKKGRADESVFDRIGRASFDEAARTKAKLAAGGYANVQDPGMREKMLRALAVRMNETEGKSLNIDPRTGHQRMKISLARDLHGTPRGTEKAAEPSDLDRMSAMTEAEGKKGGAA